MLVDQVGAATAVAGYEGLRVTPVEAHGALDDTAMVDPESAVALTHAVLTVDRDLNAMVRLALERAGLRQKLLVARMVHADRPYDEDQTSPKVPGAVVHEAAAAAAAAAGVPRIVEDGGVTTETGRRLPVRIDTVLVHDDHPRIVAMARTVRDALRPGGGDLRACPEALRAWNPDRNPLMVDTCPSAPKPVLRVAGPGGLVMEFGSAVDAKLNRLVVALDVRLRASAWRGVIETVPTYRSLLVTFDPLVADRRALASDIAAMARGLPLEDEATGRRWHVPVSYGGSLGEDLRSVADLHGLDPDEVVRHHSAGEYRVFMIGFAPGFAYLGGLPEILHTPRRSNPRQRIPAGSITVGGRQAAVTSIAGPSGWHALGRTPLRTFDLARPDPFLFRPGDRVRFRPVSATEFARLSALADGGAVTADLDEIA